MNLVQAIGDLSSALSQLAKATPEQRQAAMNRLAIMAHNANAYPVLFARMNRLYPSLDAEAMAKVDSIVSQPMNQDAANRVWVLLDGGDDQA